MNGADEVCIEPRPANPLFLLAPMDGMSRASFRSICFDYGADGATTEMIQSLALGRAKKRMSDTFEEVLVRYPNERSLAAQLIGSVPDMMAESARRLTALRRFDALCEGFEKALRSTAEELTTQGFARATELAERILMTGGVRGVRK